MLFNIRSTFTAISALLLLLNVRDVDSSPTAIDTNENVFLGSRLYLLGALGQSRLILLKRHEPVNGIHYADGEFNDKPVHVVCNVNPDKKNHSIMEIYKKLSETTVKDPSLIAGKQFLPSVKHTFPFLKGSCAIVEYRCDESLQIFRYATALQPDFMRKSEMKRLYGQIKKGVDYLAKLGFLYNDEPIDICLNADMNVMLKDFGKALRLEMPKNLGGILTAEQAAKNNNAILIYHSKVKGFLSKPPTETEKAKAESDMTEIRSQIQMNRASSRRRRPENLRVLTRTGSGAIISSSSSSSSPESPSIEPLPLYELLPPPYTSKPLSPNSPSSQRGEPPSYESSRLDHQ